MNRTWHLRIRKTHRYLGLFIGVQSLRRSDSALDAGRAVFQLVAPRRHLRRSAQTPGFGDADESVISIALGADAGTESAARPVCQCAGFGDERATNRGTGAASVSTQLPDGARNRPCHDAHPTRRCPDGLPARGTDEGGGYGLSPTAICRPVGRGAGRVPDYHQQPP